MSWIGSMAEFCSSFGAAFIERRAKIKEKRKFIGSTQKDMDIAAYNAVENILKKECLPLNDHVSNHGIKKLCETLPKKDHFKSQFAIDANPGPNKRELCVYLLKGIVTYLCTENPSDLIRAATYTMLVC